MILAVKRSPNSPNPYPPFQMAVLELHSLLTNTANRAALVGYLHQACNAAAGSMTELCNSYVDQFSQLLLDSLAKYLDQPDGLCKQLRLCPLQQQQPLQPLIPAMSSSWWGKASSWLRRKVGGGEEVPVMA